jgi:hypothetical protein
MRIALTGAAVLLLGVLASSEARACTMHTFSALLGDSQATFVGQATADTLQAGAGTVTIGSGHGHHGRTDRQAIYGQRVRIERLGGPAARLLPQGTPEVVVVPWDYDSMCRPLPWGRSARWVAPGTQGFYIARLRAPEHWADGLPTFDIHNPGNLPYTGSVRIREQHFDPAAGPLLSPEQVFDLYQAMPTADDVDERKAEALGPLQRWVRDHPDLARRPPADMILRNLVHSVARAELLVTDHPVLGTWRFRVRTPDNETHTFYARTEAHPTTRWPMSLTRVEPEPGRLVLPPAEGFSFLVAVSGAADSLPMVRTMNYRMGHIASLAVTDSSAENGEWAGVLESTLLQHAFPENPVIRRAAEEAHGRFSYRFRRGLPPETPARFVRGEDGTLRVSQQFPLSDGRVLSVEGEQVSREVIARPR